MIHEALSRGASNARSGRELQSILGLTSRQITKGIEIERRAGWPICASCYEPRGYYLAESRDEMERYCHSLAHRHREVERTLEACLATLSGFSGSECG